MRHTEPLHELVEHVQGMLGWRPVRLDWSRLRTGAFWDRPDEEIARDLKPYEAQLDGRPLDAVDFFDVEIPAPAPIPRRLTLAALDTPGIAVIPFPLTTEQVYALVELADRDCESATSISSLAFDRSAGASINDVLLDQLGVQLDDPGDEPAFVTFDGYTRCRKCHGPAMYAPRGLDLYRCENPWCEIVQIALVPGDAEVCRGCGQKTLRHETVNRAAIVCLDPGCGRTSRPPDPRQCGRCKGKTARVWRCEAHCIKDSYRRHEQHSEGRCDQCGAWTTPTGMMDCRECKWWGWSKVGFARGVQRASSATAEARMLRGLEGMHEVRRAIAAMLKDPASAVPARILLHYVLRARRALDGKKAAAQAVREATAQWANAEGVPTASGKPWSEHGVERALEVGRPDLLRRLRLDEEEGLRELVARLRRQGDYVALDALAVRLQGARAAEVEADRACISEGTLHPFTSPEPRHRRGFLFSAPKLRADARRR